MREIKFRGKQKTWIYGGYSNTFGEHQIINDNGSFTVESKSLGQFTGLKDKNGIEVYENDVAVYFFETSVINNYLVEKRGYEIGVVTYRDCGFFMGKEDDITIGCFVDEESEFEVIGNIHDNPELLK